jgi:glutathione S-transferase
MVQPMPNLAIPARLITIPVSHYCEKTRWALTRLQIPFVEERHMPPFHRWATREIDKGSRLGHTPETERNTSSLNRLQKKRNMSSLNRWITQKIGGQSVPVLITETSILKSSDEILNYVDAIAPDALKLYPTNPEHRNQIDKLVHSFDSVLAPAVRLWSYSYLMKQAHLIQPLWCEGVPWFERLFFPVMFPWMRSNALQMYGISDVSTIAAHESINRIFETVGNLLADGRAYLVGDRFSAADLAFATLAAAVVVPPGYGVKLPELSQLPDQIANSIQRFRETLAGKFVFHLYREHERIGQEHL